MTYAFIAMGFTVLILIAGIIVMISGGKLNRKFSSKLMSLRVVFQVIAILILAGVYFFSKHSSS
jgi:hypothetical protein